MNIIYISGLKNGDAGEGEESGSYAANQSAGNAGGKESGGNAGEGEDEAATATSLPQREGEESPANPTRLPHTSLCEKNMAKRRITSQEGARESGSCVTSTNEFR
jgi:hypothetical protein